MEGYLQKDIIEKDNNKKTTKICICHKIKISFKIF
jgi:hypothetical protein